MAYIKKINLGNTQYDIIDGKNIATLESSSTATQSYEIGDYIIYNGTLYKVTAAIAVGGTITIGSNVTPVTVSSELKSINSSISVLPSTLSDFVISDDQATPTSEVDFSSADTTLDPTTTESVELLTAVDSWSARLHKISQMFKNIRYLLKMLGTSDFSNVASTVSGAIGNTALTTTATTLSGAVAEHEGDISSLDTLIGDTALTTTAQTVTGAIAEHEEDISTINGNLSRKFIETAGASVDLTTAYSVVPCANVAANTNTEYLGTGSNGIVCKKSGRVLVELWARAINLTTADFVAIQFCVYRNGSLLFDSYSAVASGKTIVSLSLNRQVRDVEAGDVICLRAQNQSGARGNLYPFRMNVEYL